MKWHRKAAEQGHTDAQYNLGVMYEKGQGVPHSFQEASMWFRKAAELGHASAQSNLGVMYQKGQGVPLNFQEAWTWSMKAAEQGNTQAQFNLGAMYEQGQGIPQDYVRAHKWYNLTCASRDNNAEAARDALAKKMTPAQIAEALQLVNEWTPNEK